MEYLHSQNIYYGDMKEENLLVFRDYAIKLGDFGISIKMKDKVKAGESDEYTLKGMTLGYTTPLIESYFKESSKVERKDLIKNDY
jgi:serine/threonine protein kinase